MNKRIEQLIESCTYVDSIGVDETVYYSFDKEKFAELLIQECIDTIVRDTANYPGEGMMAYYQGVQDAGKSIKQHFGVEE